MIKRFTLAVLASTLLSSCVTRGLYNDLNRQYEEARIEKDALHQELDELRSALASLQKKKEDINAQLDELHQERQRLNAEIAEKSGELDQLKSSYDHLADYSEAALKTEAEHLQKAQDELEQRSKRVDELERQLAAHEQQMTLLKDNLSKALNTFEGKGLTIEQKNGKVYVSMENKLLFKSGSWAVSEDGRHAVEELGKVLASNPDISVLIEGHTDNDRVLGSLGSGVESNWDLSTKRATAIVTILETIPNIRKNNLTAAGRSEFAPMASNSTAEGKAKNRRIEVILTPNLDEINQLLNTIP